MAKKKKSKKSFDIYVINKIFGLGLPNKCECMYYYYFQIRLLSSAKLDKLAKNKSNDGHFLQQLPELLTCTFGTRIIFSWHFVLIKFSMMMELLPPFFGPIFFFLRAAYSIKQRSIPSSIAIGERGGRVLWVNSKGQSPSWRGHLSSNKICLLILKVVVWHETLHTINTYRVPYNNTTDCIHRISLSIRLSNDAKKGWILTT